VCEVQCNVVVVVVVIAVLHSLAVKLACVVCAEYKNNSTKLRYNYATSLLQASDNLFGKLAKWTII